jgi:hypothetical protein
MLLVFEKRLKFISWLEMHIQVYHTFPITSKVGHKSRADLILDVVEAL